MKGAKVVLGTLGLSCGLAGVVYAAPSSVSGAYNGLQWTASNMLTGTTSTLLGGPVANGGDPLYWPVYPRDTGVVALLMNYGAAGNAICSGTLLPDRQSILTAAHCVSSGAGTAAPLSTTVHFQPEAGLDPGTRTHSPLAPGVQTRTVTTYTVHPQYTGRVIDHNDIAVLRLDTPAPAYANTYGLYTGFDIEGKVFTMHGYGNLGDGATGATNFAPALRNGDNRYDYQFGNAVFGNNWSAVLGEPMSQIRYSVISDFDFNNTPGNDTACLLALAPELAGAAGAAFCYTGLGAREVAIAGGDSGGPNFINGLISGVNSFGMSFGAAYGDAVPGVNSSFGEFSGYVPVNIHTDFINAALVPEPATYSMMLAGLLAVGSFARRRD